MFGAAHPEAILYKIFLCFERFILFWPCIIGITLDIATMNTNLPIKDELVVFLYIYLGNDSVGVFPYKEI